MIRKELSKSMMDKSRREECVYLLQLGPSEPDCLPYSIPLFPDLCF